MGVLGRVTVRRLVALLLLGGLMATSVAPLITAWQRTHANTPGPLSATTTPFVFPSVPQEFHFEIFVGGSWLDITADVRYSPRADLERGRADESQRTRSRIGFAINNSAGTYSPRNPTGPYYGLIGRNTPVRISARSYFRFHGEVVAWPTQWDKSESDVWVDIEAAGVMRRLGQGAKPLKSPLYRAISRSDAVAYWPLEDGVNATQAAAALGGPAMSVTFASGPGEFPFGASGPPGGGTTVDTTGDGDTIMGLTAPVTSPLGAGHNQWMIQSVWRAELTFTPGQSTPIRLDTYDAIAWFPQLSATGTFSVRIFDLAASALITELDSGVNVLDSVWHHTAAYVRQAGADLAVKLYLDGVQVASTTLAGRTIGAFKKVALSVGNPSYPRVGHLYLTESASTADGALTVDPNHVDAIYGHAGETAADRMARLCSETGIPFVVIGDPARTAPLGPQQIDTLLNLLHHAAEADQGILYEPREFLGLAYRTRTSLYNQAGGVELDYAAAHLFGGVAPVDDDQQVVNDVEAKRIGGSSAQYTVDTGPLSTQDPPAGVGVYDESQSYNVYADDQLLDIASARAHIGTWDEARYPQITVALHSPELADPDLLAALLTVEVGDRIVVVNPPAWLPPDDIELLVQGVVERFDPHTWTITWNCVPYGPYQVFRIREGEAGSGLTFLGHLAPAGQTLNGQHAADAVDLSVTTASGYPLFSTDTNDYPVDIMVAGERITVGLVTGFSSPQTLSVNRAVNGVSKVLPAGSPIVLAPDYRTGIAR